MKDEIPKIPIITVCRDCVFAEYWEGSPTDKGCKIGLIEKYENQDVEIVGLKDDDGTKYLAIMDRCCVFCHNKNSPYLKDKTPDQYYETIRDYVKVRYAAILYVGVDATKENVTESIRNICSLPIAPKKLVLIIDKSSITPPGAISIIKAENLPCSWEVVKPEDWIDNIESELYQDNYQNRAIDIALKKIDTNKITYYYAVDTTHSLPPSVLTKIDIAVNEEMTPLVVGICPNDILFVSTKFHMHCEVVGNAGEPIRRKLEVIKESYPELCFENFEE